MKSSYPTTMIVSFPKLHPGRSSLGRYRTAVSLAVAAAAAPPLPPSLSLKSLPTAEPLARLLPLPRLDLEPMLLSDRATLFNDLVGDVPRDDATDGDGMTPRMMEYEPAMEAEL